MYKKLFIIFSLILYTLSCTHATYEISRKIGNRKNLQQGNYSWEKFKDTLNNSEYWQKIREGENFGRAFRNIYRSIQQNVTNGMVLEGARYWLEETSGQPAISTSVHSDATGRLHKNETSLRIGSQHIYVLQPHEYVSKRENIQLSPQDVPFFYYCDPEETPRKFGNMTDVEKYCSNDNERYAVDKSFVRKIVVAYKDERNSERARNSSFYQNDGNLHKLQVNGNFYRVHDGGPPPLALLPYYAMATYKGSPKIAICVQTYTSKPIELGCTLVAPAVENPASQRNRNNRCAYFTTKRSDLKSVARSVSNLPLKNFLTSDYHVLSTTVGCAQDALTELLIEPRGNNNRSVINSVFDYFRDIVLATITLSLVLFGITIISSPNEINKKMIFTQLLKFALVLFFSSPSAWVQDSATSFYEAKGILPALLSGSEAIGGIFWDALEALDITPFCRATASDGQSLLRDRTLTVDGLGTFGYPANVVKLSIWDMLDCKLANIFAMGSCKYTLFGSIAINIAIQTLFIIILSITAIMMIKAGIKATIATSATVIGAIFSALFALAGFLLLICLVPYTVFVAIMGIPILIYAAMIIDVLLRFALLTVVSFVIIIILIISAPLFLCFYLFEATAGITRQWIGMLIGYMIYPGILVAFLALLLYAVDITLYNLPSDTLTGDALSACQNTKSFFCHYANYIGENPCTAPAASNVFNFLAKPLDIILFKNVKLFDSNFFAFFPETVKLAVLCFIISLIYNGIAGYFAVMLDVEDDISSISENFSMISAVKGSMKTAKKALSKKE